jgi:hypothetical protein
MLSACGYWAWELVGLMPERISPLAQFVVDARETGKHRTKMGEYKVDIHQNYALFGHPDFEVPGKGKGILGKPNRRKRGS